MSKLDKDDIALWEYFTKDVEKLPLEKEVVSEKAEFVASDVDSSNRIAVFKSEKIKVGKKQIPDLEFASRGNIDASTVAKMDRGKYGIDSVLDLHGLRLSDAFNALQSFIKNSAVCGHRMLLIITGHGNNSGGGVIRQSLADWLNNYDIKPLILRFSQARPKDGGEGAFYVLLRRQR